MTDIDECRKAFEDIYAPKGYEMEYVEGAGYSDIETARAWWAFGAGHKSARSATPAVDEPKGRQYQDKLGGHDMCNINLKLAYDMLSDIEVDPRIPMSVRAAISGFLANRHYLTKPEPAVGDDVLVEILADIEHARWSRWMRYMWDNYTQENIARWNWLITTPYSDLPEHSKESDRKEARITLDAIRPYLAPKQQFTIPAGVLKEDETLRVQMAGGFKPVQQDGGLVEEIKPCPYVNGWGSNNSGVSFMLKRYEHYSDFVLFEDGKPSRCFRFCTAEQAMTEQGECYRLREDIKYILGELAHALDKEDIAENVLPPRLEAMAMEYTGKDLHQMREEGAAHNPPSYVAAPKQQSGEQAQLREALQGLLKRYTDLANSGDAGFWDCEKEDEVIAARKALTTGNLQVNDTTEYKHISCGYNFIPNGDGTVRLEYYDSRDEKPDNGNLQVKGE